MKTCYLSWEQPACTAIAQKLLTLDNLGDCLVLVPTRESGRQLREELTLRSADCALFSPRVLPIGSFLQPEDKTHVASSLLELASWVQVLHTNHLEEYPHLFPKPPHGNLSYLLDVAEQMMLLRNTLAHDGVPLDDVINTSEEKERWSDLNALNKAFAQQVRSLHLIDSATALWQEAANPQFAQELAERPQSTLIVAGIPELSRPLQRALKETEKLGVNVEIWIHAPASLSEYFNQWGCPIHEHWTNCPITLNPEQITVTSTPTQLAQASCTRLANLIPNTTNQVNPDIAIGICDTSMTTPIESALSLGGWGLYRPTGKPFSGTGLMGILHALTDSIESPDTATPLLALMKSPLLADSIGLRQHYQCCIALDQICEKWLPESSGYILKILRTLGAIKRKESHLYTEEQLLQKDREDEQFANNWETLLRWRDSMRETNQLGTKLVEWCANLPQNTEEGNDTVNILQQGALALQQLQSTCHDFEEPLYAIRLLTRHLQKSRVKRRRTPNDSLDAQGWLELAYCPEQHLIITGLTEGIVPEGKLDDPFLPELLKNNLRMTSYASKSARDAFLLTSLLESRKKQGSVSIIISRTNTQNDPLIPSSLLMRCPDNELSQRVNLLFGKQEQSSQTTPYHRGSWFLSPPHPWGSQESVTSFIPGFVNPWAQGDKGFSPSSLKNFITCPLRFWIKTGLKLNDSDTVHLDKKNLLSTEFGNLLHDILEEFARRYPAYQEGMSVSLLRKEILELAQTHFRANYADEALLPLLIQRFSLESRLEQYASIHLNDLKKGWECIEFERTVSDWRLDGHLMNFRIDRIDRHPNGKICVIDYKSGKIEPCQKEHLKCLSEQGIERLPLLSPDLEPCPSQFANRKALLPHRWINLQLPIYALWASEHYGVKASASYYSIPATKKDIQRLDWINLHDPIITDPQGRSYIDFARAWASTCMRLITNGQGLISAEALGWSPPEYDLFKDIVLQDRIEDLLGIKMQACSPSSNSHPTFI
ncbi:MAG: PD-(D/E)XK nuclease family protein [Akkermansia sp.]